MSLNIYFRVIELKLSEFLFNIGIQQNYSIFWIKLFPYDEKTFE